jgi:hypothetical protein
MPRLPGGFSSRASLGTVLRTTGMVLGGLLGAAAVWLIVTTDSTKNVKLGVVLGLWGIVLAGFAASSARRHDTDESGSELAVRSSAGLDRVGDAAAVRHYEERLQALLRHQIEQTLGPELAGLRRDVASMRSELVEKVGGQLRLERIETTRLFGSDIEALQQEIEQLKVSRAAASPNSVVQAVTGRIDRLPPQRPATTRPASPPVDVQPDTTTPAAAPDEPAAPPPVVTPAASEHSAAGTPASSRWVPPSTVNVSPSVRPAAEPAPAASDPFSALPRIQPFTDFDLDPADAAGAAGNGGPAPGEAAAQSSATSNGDEARAGRRRRDSDEGHDILSQILQREHR